MNLIKSFAPPEESDRFVEICVIYDHPSDYPDLYVVRRWEVRAEGSRPDEEPLFCSANLGACQEVLINRNLIRFPRDPRDDPKILEVWL